MKSAVIIGLCLVLVVQSLPTDNPSSIKALKLLKSKSIDSECVKSPSHGSTNGTDYEDNSEMPCGVNIVGFNIRHGEFINGLQMKYIDREGKTFLGAWGGRNVDGNLTQANFTYGEILRGISGMVCTSNIHYFGTYIRQIMFTAETENRVTRRYGPYGEPTVNVEQASCGIFSIGGNIKSVFGKKVKASTDGKENLGAIGAHLLMT